MSDMIAAWTPVEFKDEFRCKATSEDGQRCVLNALHVVADPTQPHLVRPVYTLTKGTTIIGTYGDLPYARSTAVQHICALLPQIRGFFELTEEMVKSGQDADAISAYHNLTRLLSDNRIELKKTGV